MGSIPTQNWFMRHFVAFPPSSDVGRRLLRAGGTTALVLVVIPLIQAIGRWSSEAFQIYIQHHLVFLAALVYSSSASHQP